MLTFSNNIRGLIQSWFEHAFEAVSVVLYRSIPDSCPIGNWGEDHAGVHLDIRGRPIIASRQVI